VVSGTIGLGGARQTAVRAHASERERAHVYNGVGERRWRERDHGAWIREK
jgi:hypothetical protein